MSEKISLDSSVLYDLFQIFCGLIALMGLMG